MGRRMRQNSLYYPSPYVLFYPVSTNNQQQLDLLLSPGIPPKPRPVKKTCPEQSRRKRGGQSGNHNARTHGLYSSAFLAADITEFSQDVFARGIDPDIALARAKLRSLLLHAPSSRRVIDDAARSLANIYSVKLQLDKTNTRLLKRLFLAIIESYSLIDDCAKTKTDSQNESNSL